MTLSRYEIEIQIYLKGQNQEKLEEILSPINGDKMIKPCQANMIAKPTDGDRASQNKRNRAIRFRVALDTMVYDLSKEEFERYSAKTYGQSYSKATVKNWNNSAKILIKHLTKAGYLALIELTESGSVYIAPTVILSIYSQVKAITKYRNLNDGLNYVYSNNRKCPYNRSKLVIMAFDIWESNNYALSQTKLLDLLRERIKEEFKKKNWMPKIDF